MKRTMWFLVLVCALSAVCWVTPAMAEESLEEGAKRVVGQMMDGWNAGDGKQFAAPFTEDAGYRVWFGRLLEGKEAIATGHQEIFDTVYRGTELKLEVVKVRSITDRVGLVYLEGRIWRNGEAVVQRIPGWQNAVPLLVLVEKDGVWWAAQFQNTPKLQMGPPPESSDESPQ